MKGMLNLEAIIFFLAYFALIGIFVNSLQNANSLMEEKKDFISAKSDAVKCTLLSDSIYSNSGGKVEIKENCFFEEGKIKSKVKEQIAEKETLTEKIVNSEKGIEIGVEEHYR